jgi:AraC-like DNA-binding protein
MNSEVQTVSAAARPPEFFSPQVTQARRFYLDLNPPRRAALTVVCGGMERCARDYAIQRATFPYLAIEFVAQGRGTLRLKGRRHELRAGRLFCYGPGVSQQITTSTEEVLVKFFVNFAGRGAASLLRVAGLAPGKIVQVFAPNEIALVFEEVIHNGLKATRHSPAICARLIEVLMLKIAESSAASEGLESQAFVTYQHCRQHLRGHFQRLRTLEQAAAECHVNVAHLCRLFRRFDHQSPYQFLLRLKMNCAAEQLHEPTVLVKQVAEKAGFSDPFHFSRAFKGVFGVSPDAFRKLR